MINWGDIPIGTVIPFPFAAFGTNGESLTLSGLATTDIEVYKGTSMTQRASDNGFALMDTDGIDIDSRTGIHGFSIDTGDNSDASFYSAGDLFWVVVDAVTINSQTVRFVAGTFRLVPATSSAGVSKVDVSHFGGSAGTFASGRPEVNVNSITNNAITAASIASDAITAAKIANGAIDAATFAADVDAEILSYLVDDATRIDASALNTASSRVATALPNAAPAANGGLPTVNASNYIAGMVGTINTLDALDTAQDSQHSTTQGLVTTVDGVVDAILVDTAEIGAAGAGLTALASATNLAIVDTVVDAIKVTTDKLDDTLEDDGGTYRFTTNALEQAPSGSGPSAADIADAVWEEALGDHSATSGSTAEALAAAGGAGDPWITPLPGSYTSGQAGKIVGDFLNASVSSRASQTSVDDLPTNAELATALDPLPTAAENATAVWGAGARTLTALDEDSTTLDLDATIRAAVGLASANLDTQIGDLPTNSELSTALGSADDAVLAAIAGLNDLDATEVQTAAAAALTAYDPPTRAELTSDTNSVLAAVGDVPTNAELATALDALPTAAENADAVWDEQVDGTVTARQSVRLANSALGGKASGLDTTNAVYRDLADSKDRIDATVDSDGNRTAITLDLT